MPGRTNTSSSTGSPFDAVNWYTEFAHICLPAVFVDTSSADQADVHARLKDTLTHFGSVVPILGTGTGPKINTNGPACSTVAEIHHFLASFKSRPSSSIVVLRPEAHINPAFLFRIFIANRSIVAVSQTDTTRAYPYLEPLKEEIKYEIDEFYENHLQTQLSVDNCVADVYVPYPFQRCWLMDLAAFDDDESLCDTALFTKGELKELEHRTCKNTDNLDDEDYEFRLVQEA